MISIIVHNWNRSFLLPLFIKSYARQDFREDEVEMIIIDDNSPPESNFEQYLKLSLSTFDIKENLWFKIRSFINKDSTRNSGRTANIGAKLAKGNILIFNHTDIFPMHKYTLSLIYKHFKQHNKLNLDNSYYQDMLYLTSSTITNDKLSNIPDCNGETPWASAIYKKLFYTIGGFDERFKGYGHEDADFAWRVIYGIRDTTLNGLKAVHIKDPSIVFVHLQQANMINIPPPKYEDTIKNAELVNDNITNNHRWIVNQENPNWGISKNIEEIKL